MPDTVAKRLQLWWRIRFDFFSGEGQRNLRSKRSLATPDGPTTRPYTVPCGGSGTRYWAPEHSKHRGHFSWPLGLSRRGYLEAEWPAHCLVHLSKPFAKSQPISTRRVKGDMSANHFPNMDHLTFNCGCVDLITLGKISPFLHGSWKYEVVSIAIENTTRGTSDTKEIKVADTLLCKDK